MRPAGRTERRRTSRTTRPSHTCSSPLAWTCAPGCRPAQVARPLAARAHPSRGRGACANGGSTGGSTRKVAVGTTKKSTETRSKTWFWRNVRQVCEGGFGRRGMRRATVRCETSKPSLSSSRCQPLVQCHDRVWQTTTWLVRAAGDALRAGSRTLTRLRRPTYVFQTMAESPSSATFLRTQWGRNTR